MFNGVTLQTLDGVLSELGKLQSKLQWEEVELTTKHEVESHYS
jgi:hypothetical protein